MQQQETTTIQNRTSKLPQKEEQELRQAYSEISNKMEKLIIISSRNPCPDVVAATASTYADKAAAGGGGSEVETVRCACCGVTEDCTATYIGGVRAAFCGDWVCGLCAEAVKERMRRDPAGGVEAALGSHEAECRDFNATTRLNPTLSLAGSMRDIARRSFDRRTTTSKSCQDRHLRAAASKAVALARSVSCDPRFLADVIINNNGPAGDRCR